jgi:glycosyltransferase involved in cell wall biosynthesis
MKILILNWRDIENPAGGGAEILTHELAKGWVEKGYEVRLLSASFKNAEPRKNLDGVEIIRLGRWWNIHIFSFFYYIFYLRNTDIIIDEVHWFPFFSAVYARKKTVALTCEVANKLFFTLFPYPIAILFRGIEKLYLYIYRTVPTLTISESTKKDLIKEGVGKEFITVLNLGIHIPKNLPTYKKEKNPTFLYLARLNKQKGIYDAVTAFSLIKQNLPASKFWIVGLGEKKVEIAVKKMAQENGLSNSVTFFGFVPETKKYELLGKAHLLLVPPAQEGWGLTVIEAGHQGTPSVAYDVEGLRDSVVDKKTGILTEPTPEALAKEALKLMTKKQEYAKLSKGTKEWSRKFDWEKTQKKSLEVLENFYRKTR